jgi:hypothetical protein
MVPSHPALPVSDNDVGFFAATQNHIVLNEGMQQFSSKLPERRFSAYRFSHLSQGFKPYS